MPARCAGFSRRVRSDILEQCPYDAALGESFCYFHGKIAAGDIAPMSWTPRLTEPKKKPDEGDPLHRLRVEWDLE